jgi:hypothetical protein
LHRPDLRELPAVPRLASLAAAQAALEDANKK